MKARGKCHILIIAPELNNLVSRAKGGKGNFLLKCLRPFARGREKKAGGGGGAEIEFRPTNFATDIGRYPPSILVLYKQHV